MSNDPERIEAVRGTYDPSVDRFTSIGNVATGRGASYVIAASDSSASDKSQADAVCDGTADDVEIQSALTTLNTAGGGILVIMQGTYDITATLTVGDWTTVQGTGKVDFVLNATESLTDITLRARSFKSLMTNLDHSGGNTNITIKNIRIDFQGDGRDDEQNWAGFWFQNCEYVTMEDCRGYDVVKVVDIDAGYEAFGILITDSLYVDLNRCEGSNCGYEGIGIRGPNRYVTLRNCFGWTNERHFIQVARFAMTDSDGGQDVSMYDCYGDTTLTIHGTATLTSRNITMTRCYAGGFLKAIGDCSFIRFRDCEGGILTAGYTGTHKSILITPSGNDNELIENIIIEGLKHIGLASAWSYPVDIRFDADNCVMRNIIVKDSYMTGGACISIQDSGSGNEIHNLIIENNHGKEVTGGFSASSVFIYDQDTTGCIKSMIVKNNYVAVDTVFQIDSTITDMYLTDNELGDSTTIFSYGGAGAVTNLRSKDNLGYVTSNKGTSTLVNGNTSIVVAHGLDITPDAGNIQITPIETLNNASFFWVDTITSTQFTINVDSDPGQDVDFAWRISD